MISNGNLFANAVNCVTGVFSIYDELRSNHPLDVKIMGIASTVLSRANIATAVCVGFGFGFCATIVPAAALKFIAVTVLANMAMRFIVNERMRFIISEKMKSVANEKKRAILMANHRRFSCF